MRLTAQIIGVLAVATFLISYQLKRRKSIIALNAISSMLYVIQYVLLGAFEGAMMDVLSTAYTVAAHNKDRGFISEHIRLVVVMFKLSIIVAGVFLYRNIFSLFSIAGALLQVGAFWLTEEKNIRLVSFFAAPCWLVYNFVNGAYGPATGSLMTMVSIGFAIYRYDIVTKNNIREVSYV